MTVPVRTSDDDFESPRWLRGPIEGWSSLVLLGVMLLAVAGAVDDARWAGTLRGASQTGFVPLLVLLAAGWGFLSGKSRLPALAADIIGALLGTAAVLYFVGGILSTSPDLGTRLQAVVEAVYQYYQDLVVQGIRSSQTVIFLLVLGAAVWAAGQVAAFSIYRRHRPLSAVGIAGLALLVELCVAAKDQYVFLIVFAAAALLLLVRLNLLEQRVGWGRRSIADANQVSGLYLRSGVGFIALALVGALVLTATASSAPLAGVVDQPAVRDQLVHWGQQLNLVVGGLTGNPRGPNGLFTSSSTISGVWISSDTPVFTARSSDGAGHYMRGSIYDAFDGATWKQSERSGGLLVDAAQPVLASSKDAVFASKDRVPLSVQVKNLAIGGATVLAPEDVLTVDRPTVLYTNGADGPLAMVELASSLGIGQTYQVQALIRPAKGAPGAPTEADLIAAGQTAFPTWTARYTQTDGLGPRARQTADQIKAGLPGDQRDPFHLAKAVQALLHDSGTYHYNTNVQGLCQENNRVECFLITKQGYCEYFATTMAMLLRAEGIPTRYVKGYLPGQRLPDGSYEVDQSAAHAWVQVYFPGWGWIDFDPTPGNFDNGQQAAQFDPGVQASATPEGASPPVRPTFGDDQDARRSPGVVSGTGTTDTGGPGNTGPLAILVVGLVALAVGGLAWRSRARRRGPAPEADAVYRGMTRWAARLGYAPLPTQTAYEYAGALGELVPAAREELQLVARAKVEGTYAHRPFQGDRLAALHAAYRRLRVRLLRLLFRRTRGFR
ncbi:MAG: transglutaminase TgpA family protein [Candidatus Limnocylindrales bacterium]